VTRHGSNGLLAQTEHQRMPRQKTPSSYAQARRAAALCLDLKATNVVMLDLEPVSDATDYFVIASGNSDTHVRAIAEHVLEELRKEGVRAHHIEGLQQGRWVLLDYIDFVVHVFHPVLRDFYQLERLWSDARAVAIDREGAGV
jgi:ribosome-associated protein